MSRLCFRPLPGIERSPSVRNLLAEEWFTKVSVPFRGLSVLRVTWRGVVVTKDASFRPLPGIERSPRQGELSWLAQPLTVSVPFRGLSVLREAGRVRNGMDAQGGFRPLPGIERSPSLVVVVTYAGGSVVFPSPSGD